MDKKSPSQVIKDVVERKQVTTRLVYGDIKLNTTGVQIQSRIDIPFEVGRIVCDHIIWSGDFKSTESAISLISSDLFENQPFCAFGDSYSIYENATADTALGITQVFCNSEIVFKEPKKIRNTYSFPLVKITGDEELGRDGELAIMLKFYEY